MLLEPLVHQWNDPASGETCYAVQVVWNLVLYASFNILLDVYYIRHYHIMADSTKYSKFKYSLVGVLYFFYSL